MGEVVPEPRSGGSGEKRGPDDVELEGPDLKKKVKGLVAGDMKRVAEMLLVLSAMGKIRGGRCPTVVEKEMMVEARDKLAHVCQMFAPEDLFPRDAFGGVIEDLGLSKLREQKLGFRPPKMSIREKLMLTKRKMEKTEEFSLPSATHSSQRAQATAASAMESRSASHVVRMFPPDKASHAVNSLGNVQPASPLGNGTPVSTAPLPYQLPTSEVRPVIPGGMVSGNPVRDSSLVALPRVERQHFRVDGRPNVSSNTLQVEANSGDHSTVRTPTWSVQPASVSADKLGADNKATLHTTIKVEGGADVKSRMAPQITTSRPFITQSTSGNSPSMHPHLQGTSFVQSPPLSNTHSEIGKIIQKFLQPRLSKRPAWIPPSRDYMNKALACQTCKSAITDVDSVLVCDACEKGYHIKCLQTTNQKGIPRGEWHCERCLLITNGKPLPPKYGRVMRNINASKMPTIAAAESYPYIKASGPDVKVSRPKIVVNGNVSLQNSTTISMTTNVDHLPSEPKLEIDKGTRGTDILSGKENVESEVSSATRTANLTSGICSNNLTVSSSNSCMSASAHSSFDRYCEEKLTEVKSQPPAKYETVSNSSDHLQALSHLQASDHAELANNVETTSKKFSESQPMVTDAKEYSARACLANSSCNESEREDHGVGQTTLSETPITINGNAEVVSTSPDLFHSVDWIGNVRQVAGNKHYYQACCIKGFNYSVQEYALIHFENERSIPAKILAMWEDKKTGTKWVTVNRCYFSRDLPQAVGRPCSLETNEVYLSNYSSAVMAGLIQGPCGVLPPSKFAEERERRSHPRTGPNSGLPPLYICKWIYDESKGLFRDISC